VLPKDLVDERRSCAFTAGIIADTARHSHILGGNSKGLEEGELCIARSPGNTPGDDLPQLDDMLPGDYLFTYGRDQVP